MISLLRANSYHRIHSAISIPVLELLLFTFFVVRFRRMCWGIQRRCFQSAACVLLFTTATSTAAIFVFSRWLTTKSNVAVTFIRELITRISCAVCDDLPFYTPSVSSTAKVICFFFCVCQCDVCGAHPFFLHLFLYSVRLHIFLW